MHGSRTHKFHFSAIFSLKMGPIVLFTHLKIILLECFLVFSCIQTDPNHPDHTLTQLICGVLKCLNCGSNKINQACLVDDFK